MKAGFPGVLFGAVLLLAASGGGRAEDENVLSIYNWPDYIAEDTLANFEARTGIKVVYAVFDSNEELERALLAGHSGHDIVVPSGAFLEGQIKAGLFRPLDKAKLSNLGNLDPDIMARVAVHDPGNLHAVPYLWGTTGFAYNTAMIAERMPDAPVDSWRMLFDPEMTAKFADCGITLLDAPTDVIPTALVYLGLDPHSKTEEHLEEAAATIAAVRPHIRYIHSYQGIGDLAGGEVCLAMGWSGDMLLAKSWAEEANAGVEIAYTIPSEGANIWFDLMAIPADAPHPEAAHLFLDYILEPQVAAAITNYVNYPNANMAATGHVNTKIQGDPSIYPTEVMKAKLFPASANPEKYGRLLARAWTRIKLGQ